MHASLAATAPAVGYQLENPDGGDVAEFLGSDVPYGPLDNAARFFDFETGVAYAIPVEVKNLRDWIYPTSHELHQLLSKASELQRAHQDVRMVPVLVCRRAHKTAFRMARDLGFHIVDMYRQPIRPGPFRDPDKLRLLNEVRTELGFMDLAPTDEPDRRVVKQFGTVVPSVAARTSERWLQYGAEFGETYAEVRLDPAPEERSHLLGVIRQAMQGEPDPHTGAPTLTRGW